MVSQKYNVILVDAGSSTALNSVLESAVGAGITVVNFDLQTLIKQYAELIPIAGENYNGFLKMWNANLSKGLSSLSTAQPNYLSVVALDAAVAKIKGQKIASDIDIPLPRITDAKLSRYVKSDQPTTAVRSRTSPRRRSTR